MAVLKVRDPADPSGQTWTNVAAMGPTGPLGPTGPIGVAGPTGPTGSIGALDDLTDVDTSTTAPVDQDGLLWDAAAGMWTPGVVAAGQGVFLPLAGGTLTGPLTTAAVTAGGTITANAGISMGSDDRIDFQTNLGEKINLYQTGATKFGFGIESGTMVAYVPSANKFAVRSGTTTGAEWAFVDANGLGPTTQYTVTFVNGFSGTCDFHVTPAMVTLRMTQMHRNANTAANSQTKICDFPAGVPAPPNVSSGWRVPIHFRASDFTSDYQHGVLHIDSTSVYVIVIGSQVGSGGYSDAVVSWPR